MNIDLEKLETTLLLLKKHNINNFSCSKGDESFCSKGDESFLVSIFSEKNNENLHSGSEITDAE